MSFIKIRNFILKFNHVVKERTESKYYYFKLKNKSSNIFNLLVQNKLICVKSSNIDEAHFTLELLKIFISKMDQKLILKINFKDIDLEIVDKVYYPKFTHIYSLEKTLKEYVYSKTYFISGPNNITIIDFNKYYRKKIGRLLFNDPGTRFLVSDIGNTSRFAQDYLHKTCNRNIRIYHMGKIPRFNIGKWKTLSKFKNMWAVHSTMTKKSTNDLYWENMDSANILKYYGKQNFKNDMTNNVIRRKKNQS